MRRQINSEESQAIYTLIGNGVWQLRNVEDALDVFITLKSEVKTRGAMPLEKAIEILANDRRNTPGTSLKVSKKARVLSSELQHRLEQLRTKAIG